VSGEDKDDEAVIAEADHVRLDAIAAIDAFLQYNALYLSHVSRCRPELACIPITLLKSMIIHWLFDQLSVLGIKYFFTGQPNVSAPFLMCSPLCNIGFHLFGPTERIGS
jgi:hypothetical protein